MNASLREMREMMRRAERTASINRPGKDGPLRGSVRPGDIAVRLGDDVRRRPSGRK